MSTIKIALVFCALLLGIAPAMAGQASYADGRGKWESTQCKAPQSPAKMEHNPEAAANDLNARVALHNEFVAQSQQYMECLSKEAEFDAKAMSVLATESAKKAIEAMQQEVNASALKAQSD